MVIERLHGAEGVHPLRRLRDKGALGKAEVVLGWDSGTSSYYACACSMNSKNSKTLVIGDSR